MRTVTVYMSDGDTITTSINGTDKEIVRHYLGNRFEAGSDTKHHVALCIHFHDTDKRYGLRTMYDAVAAEHARQPFQTPEEIRQFINDGSRPIQEPS